MNKQNVKKKIKTIIRAISENIFRTSIKVLKFCFLWALIILLLVVILRGINFLLPAIKNIPKTPSISISGISNAESKTIFEAVLNNANFAIIFISVLFALISVLVVIIAAWGTRSLNRLEESHKNYKKDLKEMEKFRKETSTNLTLDGQLTTAKIFYTQKDYSVAWEYIKDLPDTFSYEVPLYKGRILFNKEKGKNYLRAIELLNKALEFPNITNEGKTVVCAFMSRVWIGAKNYKQGLIYAKKSIAEKYTYWTAHNQKAIALRRLGKLDKAIGTLKDVLKIDPTYSYAHYNLACYYCLLIENGISYKEKVIKYLKRAIELRPQFKESAKKDRDFDNIRQDSEFKELIK